MAFQMGDDHNGGMNEMNLIPLIDIMLVLMIIFLVTATVMKPSIPLTLPKTSASTQGIQDKKILEVSIDNNNTIFMEKQPITLNELQTKLTNAKNLAGTQALPSINIRADKNANYDSIAKVLATASNVGLTDIAFVSDKND